MIKTKLYFKNGTDSEALAEALTVLPEPIRPIYFAEDEGRVNKANLLSDTARFQAFLKKNSIGFFLYSENKTCIDISTPRSGYAEVTLWLTEDLSGELSVALFQSLIDCKPVFGYACEDGEYDHRNRYYITLGKNNIESWIGRKLDQYISGVYWYTLLSDGLLAQHGVKLVDLVDEAMRAESLGDGSLHLLKFFDNPEDWRGNASRLDNLCERVEGVFSRSSVEDAVIGVTNFLEYDDIIANWR